VPLSRLSQDSFGDVETLVGGDSDSDRESAPRTWKEHLKLFRSLYIMGGVAISLVAGLSAAAATGHLGKGRNIGNGHPTLPSRHS
jgi:hypothetical protein